MKKIGLITYHATHNYGAVLQAYATQHAIEKTGCTCEIINFQSPHMKFFNSLYKFPIGTVIPGTFKNRIAPFVRFLRDWRYDKKRKIRAGKFENFVHTRLRMTKEYNTIQSLLNVNFNYDMTITGSDQTWNIYAPLWRIYEMTDYSAAYFLGFVRSGKKAALAQSTSHTSAEELMPYKDLLAQYDYITVRDLLAKTRMESVLNKDVAVVLDPAFLLTKEEWIASLEVPSEPIIKNPYVLLYSVHGTKKVEKLIHEARIFAQKKSLLLVTVTPNACKKFDDVIQLYDTGPIDFLNLYNNASYVVAATFHAIVFSIIFRKSFLAFGNKYNKDDIRKNSLLSVFNLESRLITEESEINTYADIDLNYRNYEETIDHAIKDSREHLTKILDLA
jgi:hypothetical protein